MDTSLWRSHAIAFFAQQSIIAYTDGITEAQDAAGEFFGNERLEATLRGCASRSCQQVLDCLVREVRAFSPPGSQHDDITLILARRS